jgi:hypothetical protein
VNIENIELFSKMCNVYSGKQSKTLPLPYNDNLARLNNQLGCLNQRPFQRKNMRPPNMHTHNAQNIKKKKNKYLKLMEILKIENFNLK